jgi:hypothetical protein
VDKPALRKLQPTQHRQSISKVKHTLGPWIPSHSFQSIHFSVVNHTHIHFAKKDLTFWIQLGRANAETSRRSNTEGVLLPVVIFGNS